MPINFLCIYKTHTPPWWHSNALGGTVEDIKWYCWLIEFVAILFSSAVTFSGFSGPFVFNAILLACYFSAYCKMLNFFRNRFYYFDRYNIISKIGNLPILRLTQESYFDMILSTYKLIFRSFYVLNYCGKTWSLYYCISLSLFSSSKKIIVLNPSKILKI